MFAWLRNKWKHDLAMLRDRREKERHNRRILCPHCGYDVKDLPDRPCPECGRLVKSVWREGRVGAGSPNRDILASIGMIWSAAIAFYIGLIGGATAWMSRGLASTSGSDHGAAILAVGSLLCFAHAALAGYGWRFRRKLLYGPCGPAAMYFGACLALLALTFGILRLLATS